MVEFDSREEPWVANFQPGIRGLNVVYPHPNGHGAIVIASGDLWVVSPEERSAQRSLRSIELALEVHDPDGWVFSIQGIALARFGPEGLVWQTRRLSYDGFDQLKVEGDEITGLAWSPVGDTWEAFRVDLRTGRSSGGTYPQSDCAGWELLSTR